MEPSNEKSSNNSLLRSLIEDYLELMKNLIGQSSLALAKPSGEHVLPAIGNHVIVFMFPLGKHGCKQCFYFFRIQNTTLWQLEFIIDDIEPIQISAHPLGKHLASNGSQFFFR